MTRAIRGFSGKILVLVGDTGHNLRYQSKKVKLETNDLQF